MNTQKPELLVSTPFQPFYLPKRTLQEQNRLTFQHRALKAALSGNFLAPYAHPMAILDVACGNGMWTADMGKLFPNAEIVGLDIDKPTCPQSSHFQFIEGYTPSSLPFNDANFDYVHQRCLGTVLPTVHWPMVVNELVRVTQSGGWVELMEYGSSYVNAGPKTVQFCLWWQEVLASQGIDLKAMNHLAQLLQNAGLTHIEQKTLSISLCGGRVGNVMSTNLISMVQNAKTSIIAQGIDQKAIDEVVSALPKEWQECKTSYQFHTAYGQRESHKTLLSAAGHQRAVRELHVRGSRLPNVHKARQRGLVPV
jgi:ubiquinone/menaquinone biosynthesis C-methylase UbiE